VLGPPPSMSSTLWRLAEAGLLMANAVAVLNGPRFLDKCVLPPPFPPHYPPPSPPVPSRKRASRGTSGQPPGALNKGGVRGGGHWAAISRWFLPRLTQRSPPPGGLGMQSLGGDMLTGQAAPGSVKAQAIQFISASQYLRVPLIFLNIIVILVKLIFG